MYYLSIRPDRSIPGIPSEVLRLYENRTHAEKFGKICAEFEDYNVALQAFLSEVCNSERIAGTYPRVQNGGIYVPHDHAFPCVGVTIAESTGVWRRRNRNGGDRIFAGALHQAIVRASMGDYDYVWDCGNGKIVMEYCYNTPFVIRTAADPANRRMLTVMLREEL